MKKLLVASLLCLLLFGCVAASHKTPIKRKPNKQNDFYSCKKCHVLVGRHELVEEMK